MLKTVVILASALFAIAVSACGGASQPLPDIARFEDNAGAPVSSYYRWCNDGWMKIDSLPMLVSVLETEESTGEVSTGDANIPDGTPEQVVRTVTENSRTLKFEVRGYEEE